MEFVDVLRNTEVFGGLNEDELRMVAALCGREHHEAGTCISCQGEAVNKLYVVEDGLVQFQIEIGRGRSWSVDSSGKGDCFGWASLLAPLHPWASNAICVERSSFVTIESVDLHKLFRAQCRIGYAVMMGIAGLIARRLDNTRMQLAHLAERAQ